MADITSIPASRVPLLEPGSNVMSREWYRFLFNQFGQTGGGTTALSLSDLELAPLNEADGGALSEDVQGLLSAPPVTVVRRRYGSFVSSVTQTLSATNTPTAITYDTVTSSHGIGLSTTSRVLPGVAGAYAVTIVVQADKTAGGDSPLWLWLRKNGTDIVDTTVTMRIRGSTAEVTLTASLIISLGATDYIEAMWASDSTDVILHATAASAFYPAGPSAFMTITQVDQ